MGMPSRAGTRIIRLYWRSPSAEVCHCVFQGPLLNLAERRGRHTVHTYMVNLQHAMHTDALLHKCPCAETLK